MIPKGPVMIKRILAALCLTVFLLASAALAEPVTVVSVPSPESIAVMIPVFVMTVDVALKVLPSPIRSIVGAS